MLIALGTAGANAGRYHTLASFERMALARDGFKYSPNTVELLRAVEINWRILIVIIVLTDNAGIAKPRCHHIAECFDRNHAILQRHNARSSFRNGAGDACWVCSNIPEPGRMQASLIMRL